MKLSTWLPLVLLVAACENTQSSKSPYAAAPDPNEARPSEIVVPKPWTARFLKPCAFVAARVRVEGPDGLLEHCVLRQELEVLDVKIETTSEGLVQTARVKPGLQDVEVRAHLDNLSIVALQEITIVERPGPVDVVVSGVGDAFFQEKDSTVEQRGPSLRIVGVVDRTPGASTPAAATNDAGKRDTQKNPEKKP